MRDQNGRVQRDAFFALFCFLFLSFQMSFTFPLRPCCHVSETCPRFLSFTCFLFIRFYGTPKRERRAGGRGDLTEGELVIACVYNVSIYCCTEVSFGVVGV